MLTRSTEMGLLKLIGSIVHHSGQRSCDGRQSLNDQRCNMVGRDDVVSWARDRPWYMRPDQRWLRPFTLLLATGSGMIMGPRIEIGTQLVCEEILGIKAVYGADDPFSSPTTPWRYWNVIPAPHERPPLSSHCRSSPDVEAGYTALALRISLAMGILSVITTGFWGGLSDRKGRTLILRMSILGLTIGDLTYIALGLFPQSSVPLGKNLLVVGAAIEGMLGGLATLTAAHLAYIADVTPNGTRATVFSFFTGLFFFGIALGPGLGGLVVKWLHSTMAPFYFALGAHLSYFIFAALFLPESSSPERMTKAQEEHRDANAAFFTGSEGLSVTSAYMRLLLSYITLPLRPLRLLAPQKRRKGSPGQQQNSESSTPSPSQFGPILPASSTAPITVEATTAATSISAEEGDEVNATHISVSHAPADALDWNLTFAAFAYFLEASSLGIMTPKLNYAMYKFNWDASQIGYFLSFSSLVRVACLIVIIPLFVKWAHPPNRQTSLPQDGRDHTHDDLGDETPLLNEEGRPLLDAVGNNDRSYGAFGQQDVAAEDEIVSDPDYQFDGHAEHIERLWTTRALHLRQIRDSRFDRKLTLGSIAIAATAYLLLALTSNAGPIPFVALSAFISLGGAASAALSSLALAMLNNDNDSGKFFAAWSVLSAISQTIFGPVIFSALFVRTVAVAPQAIFVLGFALFVGAAFMVSIIRVRHPRSLPPLPPRPHTPASLAALHNRSEHGSNRSTGPFKSGGSRVRMRSGIPFKRDQDHRTD